METIPAITKTIVKTILKALLVGALLIFSAIVGYFTLEYLMYEGTIYRKEQP